MTLFISYQAAKFLIPQLSESNFTKVSIRHPKNHYDVTSQCLVFIIAHIVELNPKQAKGGGIRPQVGPSLCCAETVSSRTLKLSDFYYILIGLNSEYKPVSRDIYCCHGNAIVEGCSVKFWLKSVENCIFLLKSFSNLSLGLLFVISISKLPPMPNFKQIGLKTKKLGFSTFFSRTEPKIQDDVIKTS